MGGDHSALATAICVTYGDKQWADLARSHALPSLEGQCRYLHVEGEALWSGRNIGLEQVETEWVFCLDADDQIAEGYVEAMLAGTADIRAPLVQHFVRGKIWRHPLVPGYPFSEHKDDGDWLNVGSFARTELVRSLGGWRDLDWMEDADLWLRAWKVDATFEVIHGAVYLASVTKQSMSHSYSEEDRAKQYALVSEMTGVTGW